LMQLLHDRYAQISAYGHKHSRQSFNIGPETNKIFQQQQIS
jgi:hypothetical protein